MYKYIDDRGDEEDRLTIRDVLDDVIDDLDSRFRDDRPGRQLDEDTMVQVTILVDAAVDVMIKKTGI